jgi:two-component system, cell cycle response regulator
MAHILFVDDDPNTLQTLSKSAQILGYQSLLAHSGEEAVNLAVSQLPDLILTDMNLADMDGLTLIRILRQDKRTAETAIVVLSASPEFDASELSRTAGANEFLAKPVRLQTLQETIERYIKVQD